MAVYDCCMYYNETDMLLLRMNILRDAVDFHVIVEAGETHSGQPKPFNFAEERHRFREFEDKIIYIQTSRLSDGVRDSWQREAYHRSLIGHGLRNCQPDDLVIVGDCDEIVNPDVIPQIGDAAGLTLSLYYYRFTLKARSFWGIGAARYGMMKDPGGIRTNAAGGAQIENAGWHFSYFMTPDKVADKIGAFMHHDFVKLDNRLTDEHYLERRMTAGEDIYASIPGRPPLELDYTPPGEHLPAWVMAHWNDYPTWW